EPGVQGVVPELVGDGEAAAPVAGVGAEGDEKTGRAVDLDVAGLAGRIPVAVLDTAAETGYHVLDVPARDVAQPGGDAGGEILHFPLRPVGRFGFRNGGGRRDFRGGRHREVPSGGKHG